LRIRREFLLIVVVAAFAAPAFRSAPAPRDDEPAVVTVQHVLIGFKRSVPGKKLERTKAEAGELAAKILERARAGEDFGVLVEQFSDEPNPRPFRLTNAGTPRRADARPRGDLAPGFGDVAFGLEPGEVGLVKYHAASSPYGWHVIKRLE
jgi:hypothetical protein